MCKLETGTELADNMEGLRHFSFSVLITSKFVTNT